MRAAVIMPALNEAESVGQTIGWVPRGAVAEIIVVDNGSTDGTDEIARSAGARVVSEPRRGYGFACLAGSAATDADILVFLDADGSFDPGEIPDLLEPILTDRADLALGSREMSAASSEATLPHQHFGNQLAAQLLKLLYGLRVTDLGPFRAIRSDLFRRLHMSEMTYGWPVEMMVKAAQLQARIVEVPVDYRPRIGGRSKVSGTIKGSILAGYHITRTTLRHARPGRNGQVRNDR